MNCILKGELPSPPTPPITIFMSGCSTYSQAPYRAEREREFSAGWLWQVKGPGRRSFTSFFVEGDAAHFHSGEERQKTHHDEGAHLSAKLGQWVSHECRNLITL